MSFGYNYGTEIVQPEHPIDQFTGHGMTALEEENIFEHLDDLSLRERDVLDALGAEYYIKDYFQLLRVARQEQDARVNQLKVTAVVRSCLMGANGHSDALSAFFLTSHIYLFYCS